MTKTELIKQLAVQCHLPTQQVERVINAFMQTATDILAAGDTLSLVGFGNFGVKTRAARTGRHPQTQETITIPETKGVYFKAGSKLKAAITGQADSKK